MNRNNLIDALKEIKVLYKEGVVLRSGEVSDFYCDIKKAFGYPEILTMLADEIGKKIPKSATCIAASGYGGLPLASVVATRSNLKLALVRSSEKDHGKGGLIDGYVPAKDDVCVIVDDVLTSGSSIKETLATLTSKEVRVVSAVVVVKRKETELPIPYSFLFTIEDLTR
ncbi:hypothetical protein KJ819_00030 [Patescibacteria group bacterium]|nr:hypothetical protein [Patescibacteria group bacterium]MBU1500590.1 hypothetical protein [Patescibacteria group bacterium]MBU2080369.1 hypothetical protein [Patescibacteria group bacterium]MBU2124219.1 hypothetical protein [Patescibacteria group bacterium]MBU2194330.1 hypothetical protein [Patescibacteria group bacterium]